MSDNHCPCCRELMLVIDALRAEVAALRIERDLALKEADLYAVSMKKCCTGEKK